MATPVTVTTSTMLQYLKTYPRIRTRCARLHSSHVSAIAILVSSHGKRSESVHLV